MHARGRDNQVIGWILRHLVAEATSSSSSRQRALNSATPSVCFCAGFDDFGMPSVYE
jgi:hypothetical protein